MSKHICFFIGSISNGAGTERITISLANLFVKRGYRVSVVSKGGKTKCDKLSYST